MFKPFQTLIFTFLSLTSLSLGSDNVPNGTVLSHDLLTNDANKAASFYTSLFGWKAVSKGTLIELQKDSKHMASVIEVQTKEKPQWLPLFSHNNLSLAKEKVLLNKGVIIKDIKQEKGIGDFLLIRDNEGALSLLTHSSSHQTSEAFPAINEWLWDEMWSHEVQGSQLFYMNLFNYEVETTASGYIIFKQNDKWIAGLLNNPFAKSQTQWVATIRVVNPKMVSAKALSLGGKVLVSVDEHKGHRDAALIADPTGAVFIVEKYEEKGQ